MPLIISYPAASDNGFKKYFVCYRLQQKLQNVFNTWGTKFRNNEITASEWKRFQDEWYEPRIELVISEILRLRTIAKNYEWNINLNKIFVEE